MILPLDHGDRAIRDFTEAIRIDPEYADAYFHRGRSYHGLNYLQALSDYDEALRLDPTNSHYYSYREKLIKEATTPPWKKESWPWD